MPHGVARATQVADERKYGVTNICCFRAREVCTPIGAFTSVGFALREVDVHSVRWTSLREVDLTPVRSQSVGCTSVMWRLRGVPLRVSTPEWQTSVGGPPWGPMSAGPHVRGIRRA